MFTSDIKALTQYHRKCRDSQTAAEKFSRNLKSPMYVVPSKGAKE